MVRSDDVTYVRAKRGVSAGARAGTRHLSGWTALRTVILWNIKKHRAALV